MKRLKLSRKQLNRRYREYDIFACPRCKHLEFRPHWNVVGRCHSFGLPVIELGRYSLLCSSRDICSNFDIGKFKGKKKKPIIRRKRSVKTAKVG
jgi:hypothetical protein